MKDRAHSILPLIVALLLAAATLLVSPTARAHHSPAGFDSTKSVTVTGAVVKYEWVNPHVYLFVEQVTERGDRVVWQVECGPPGTMRRMGWSPDLLHIGDQITVDAWPSKTPGSHALLAAEIKRGEGSVLAGMRGVGKLTQPGELPAQGARTLDGMWATLLTMPVMLANAFPDASKLTDEGARAFKRFDDKALNPAINCVHFSPPLTMINPDLKRITIGDGVIYIEGDFDSTRRTVHMQAATHDGAIASMQGHSIGRWEGKTLVIDTTHFAYHGVGNGYGVPSGTQKHLIERLTPAADGKTLTYHFEMTDPEFLAAPRSGDVQWVFSPGATFAPEKCDPENARRFIKD